MHDRSSFVQRIHTTDRKIVLATTGGGASALAALLSVPGASRTLIEAIVPYSMPSLVSFLGGKPDQACSPITARSMAMAAFDRIAKLYPDDEVDVQNSWIGVGCTASLATSLPKRGPHQFHIGTQTTGFTRTTSTVLEKGMRTREAEESFLATALLNEIGLACGLEETLVVDHLPSEVPTTFIVHGDANVTELIRGRLSAVSFQCGSPLDCLSKGEMRGGLALFPGAFRPLHAGHRRMAQIAAQRIGQPLQFEISAVNVDKPPLDFISLKERLMQFDRQDVIWLTSAPTFVEKSRVFPHSTFVVGADTVLRIGDPKYYFGSTQLRDMAIDEIARNGCRFLTFGRQVGTKFYDFNSTPLPKHLAELCDGVDAAEFRMDISSTELRKSAIADMGSK